MKKGLWVMVLAAVAVVGCSKGDKAAAAGQKPAADAGFGLEEVTRFSTGQVSTAPDKAVARVGDEQIMQSEVDKVLHMQLAKYGDNIPDAFIAQARAQMTTKIIDMLIAQSLVRADIAARDITIDKDEMAARLEIIKAQLPEGTTIEEALASNGITQEQMLHDVREGLKVEKLFDIVLQDKPITPSDDEVKAFYENNKEKYFTQSEQLRASHILISPESKEEADWAKAKEKVEAVAKELAEGGDFAELAAKYSSCPSKKDGGDLGEFGRGRMVPEFEEAAFAQEINVIGAPVKTDFGYHLIKVTDKQPGGVTPLEDVKETIAESLTEQAKGKFIEVYINDLKAKTEVEIFQAETEAEEAADEAAAKATAVAEDVTEAAAEAATAIKDEASATAPDTANGEALPL